MNMQKTLMLLLAILAVLAVAGTLYFFMHTPIATPTNTVPLFTGTVPVTNPQVNVKNVPSKNTVEQGTSQVKVEVATIEGTLMVSDFTKISGVASTTEGGVFLSWFPGSNVATSSIRNPTYEIYYYPEGKFFIVVILKEPIGEMRRQATNDLKEKLGISDKELCTLVAEVNVPYFVNSFYAVKNLGFPGCPGAEKFEGDLK